MLDSTDSSPIGLYLAGVQVMSQLQSDCQATVLEGAATLLQQTNKAAEALLSMLRSSAAAQAQTSAAAMMRGVAFLRQRLEQSNGYAGMGIILDCSAGMPPMWQACLSAMGLI